MTEYFTETEEDRAKKKLRAWERLLLDTGKRNPLVNYKDKKGSTVQIVAPDFVTLFQRAERGETAEGFDPDEGKKPRNFEDEYEGQDGISAEEQAGRYATKLKRHQVLLYKEGGKPSAVLREIGKRARTVLEETGINIAYLALGFFRWREREDVLTELLAPILLVPVSVDCESVIDPCKIRMLGEETILNPTFDFKLQTEYGLKLPEMEDDEGIDAYFTRVQAAVEKLGWQVTTECKIGLFSFQKINMYRDLQENVDAILENDRVRAMLGEPIEISENDDERIPAPSIFDLHNVVDADFSQEEAVQAAAEGKSFVLQGPPGTGKSQTITNMIAECLWQGKKVLFVSEKLAALSVVYEKLKSVGLEEFCLELHSHKANKKEVIGELCATLQLPKKQVSGQAEKELQALEKARNALDGYAAALHEKLPVVEKSAYELYEGAAAYRSAPDTEYVIADLAHKGEGYLDEAESALRRYADHTKNVGYDYRNHVWYGCVCQDTSLQATSEMKADLSAVGTACQSLRKLQSRVETYGERADTFRRAHACSIFFDMAKESVFLTPKLLSVADIDGYIRAVEQLQTLATQWTDLRAKMEKDFDEDVFALDGKAYFKALTKNYHRLFARLFSGEYRRMKKALRLCKRDGKLGYVEAVETCRLLAEYQEKDKAFADEEKNVSALGAGYCGVKTDFAQCLQELRAVKQMRADGVTFGKLSAYTDGEFLAERNTFAELALAYAEVFAVSAEAEKRLVAKFDAAAFDWKNVDLDWAERKCLGCKKALDELESWVSFSAVLRTLQGVDLQDFVHSCIEKQVPSDEVLSAYKRAFYTQWADFAVHQSPSLKDLSRVSHDEVLTLFQQKDRLQFAINKAKIREKLSAQRPDLGLVAQGGSVSVLLREGAKKRKQKGIRALLMEVGDLAQTLKPCFLMSPLSVSTYLSADMQFDTVIFDEASQIFPQDAVGAIYRGKQLIVVGDSKQMPPSNFFTATVEGEEDEDAEDVTAFESVLDLCATALPQQRLKWHYRSRYEGLIAFSNRHFYGNDLVTFPAAKEKSDGAAVEFVFAGGVFDRTSKTNRAEAECIADMVFEHAATCPERSLGVVAFSVAQQQLIDKLIAKRRRENQDFDFFFRLDKEEPFFVKNLETVQGDERDVIIFSVAYAKDAQGRLLMNFGPLNREGGERRLNVAVTRAKYRVKTVTSMRAADMDLSATKSAGARLLRAYLDYAENGAAALERTLQAQAEDKYDSAFEQEVCEFLRGNGYAVDTQVGCSSFRIDMAVKRENSSDYFLAVECDGASYHSSKAARDRDRLRQEVLERMGWRFYRVWSTDWFRNKKAEKERLLQAVSVAAERAEKSSKNKNDPTMCAMNGETTAKSFEKDAKEKPFAFPEYARANDAEILKKCGKNALRAMSEIVKAESPVQEEWVLRRVVSAFDRKLVTDVVRRTYEEKAADFARWGVERKDGYLWKKGSGVPTLRVPKEGDLPREIKYIHPEELANGLRAVLTQNVVVEKHGLFKTVAEKLGFARVGDVAEECMEKALATMENELERHGDMLSLK